MRRLVAIQAEIKTGQMRDPSAIIATSCRVIMKGRWSGCLTLWHKHRRPKDHNILGRRVDERASEGASMDVHGGTITASMYTRRRRSMFRVCTLYGSAQGTYEVVPPEDSRSAKKLCLQSSYFPSERVMLLLAKANRVLNRVGHVFISPPSSSCNSYTLTLPASPTPQLDERSETMLQPLEQLFCS